MQCAQLALAPASAGTTCDALGRALRRCEIVDTLHRDARLGFIALPLAWFLWRRDAPWANIFQLLGIAPRTIYRKLDRDEAGRLRRPGDAPEAVDAPGTEPDQDPAGEPEPGGTPPERA